MPNENVELELIDEIKSELVITDADKLDYIFRSMVELRSEVDVLLAQAGPLLESAGPLLAQFSGQAASPIGRIAASFLR